MGKSEFPFFESYHRSFQSLPPEIVGEVVLAMGSFYYDDTEIELEGIAKAVFDLIKPVIEKKKHISEVRSEASSGHGAPENNQNASKNQTKTNKNKQTTDKIQTNDNQKQTDKEIGVRSKDIGDIKKDSPTESRKNAFIPPTLEEVEDYCKERNSSVDPKQFYEYFNTGNWIDSKGQKVKNWKQKILTWEKYKQGNGDNRASFATNKKIHNFQEREMDDEYFRKLEKICVRN